MKYYKKRFYIMITLFIIDIIYCICSLIITKNSLYISVILLLLLLIINEYIIKDKSEIIEQQDKFIKKLLNMKMR